MTIQMLATWNGLEEDAVVTLASPAEEARLITLKLARDYTVGMDGRNPVLSNAEQIANQAMVSGAGNDPAPAVRPGRGYVVAADLRAANIAAKFPADGTAPIITDVERIAPDGTKLRGIRLASSGAGTNCSFDLNIRSQKFATGRLSLLVYADHTTTGVDPNLSFYAGDSAALTNHWVCSGRQLNSRGWLSIAPGLASGSSQAKWSAGVSPVWGTTDFTRIRVRLDYTTATTPWVEVYEINYNEDAEAAPSWIGISVDDGYDSAYLIGAPAFERYGMRASFAIIADKIGTAGYMTWDQCRDLRDRGHEIVVHGPIGGTGSLANYSASPTRAADVRADVSYHRDAIIAQGCNVRGSANVYMYPQGYDRFAVGDETIRDALESVGFVGGRRAAPGMQQRRNVRGGNPWVYPYLGHYWVSGGEAANITAIVASINTAASEKQDGVLMFHKFISGAATTALEIGLSDLETLLAAVADNRLAGTQDQVLMSRLVYAQAGLQRPLI